MKSIQMLATALLEEVNETSDFSPVVTVSRAKLQKLLELLTEESDVGQ